MMKMQMMESSQICIVIVFIFPNFNAISFNKCIRSPKTPTRVDHYDCWGETLALESSTMLLIFHKAMRFLFIQNNRGHSYKSLMGSNNCLTDWTRHLCTLQDRMASWSFWLNEQILAFIFLTLFDRSAKSVEASAAFFLLLENTSGEKCDFQQETGTCWDLLRYKEVFRDTARAIKLRSGSWKANICESQRNHKWEGRTVYMFWPQSIRNGDSLCD